MKINKNQLIKIVLVSLGLMLWALSLVSGDFAMLVLMGAILFIALPHYVSDYRSEEKPTQTATTPQTLIQVPQPVKKEDTKEVEAKAQEALATIEHDRAREKEKLVERKKALLERKKKVEEWYKMQQEKIAEGIEEMGEDEEDQEEEQKPRKTKKKAKKPAKESFNCPIPDCDESFNKREDMLKHLSDEHIR